MNTYANTDGCDMPAARAKRPAFADMCGGYDFGKPLSAYGLQDSENDFILEVARDWQSPGSIGRELATLASTRVVTDDLARDIELTIIEAYTGHGSTIPGEVMVGLFGLQTVAALLSLELSNIPSSVLL